MARRLDLGVLLCSLLYVTSVSSAAKQYIITDSGGSLQIQINRITVLNHTLLSPSFYVGQGKTIFLEALGNFHVRNYIKERIALRRFSKIQNTTTSDVYNFTDGGIYSVQVTFETKLNQDVVVSFKNTGQTYTHSWVVLAASPTDKIYGGGEQFTHLNLRERTYNSLELFTVLRSDDLTYPIWTREQGVGRDKSTNTTFFADLQSGGGGNFATTYFPQPTFITSKKYYFHFTSTRYIVFDFSVPTSHEVFINGDFGDIYFKSASSFKPLVGSLSSVFGRMPKLPLWIYDGIIMGVQGGTKIMMERYQQAKAQGVNVRGLWIQDWSGIINTSFGQRVFWNWQWNATRYPGLDETIKELKKDGVRITVYMNPNLNNQGPLFKAAESNGYLVKNKTDQTYLFNFGEFFCGIVDLTNPDAYNWYKGIIKKNIIQLGIGGWMADFGEYLPVDAKLKGGSGELFHNQWPVLWAKLNREAVQESGKEEDVVFWMRAGHTGTSNYTTLMWVGDQNVDWSTGDGLPSVIPSALSSGLCGIGMTHMDIGLYTTFGALGLRRSAELLLRSAEMAVFSPVMRTHEGNQPAYNVQMYSSDIILRQFKRLVDMHKALSNYTSAAMDEYVSSGVAVQRPLFLMYPDDVKTYDLKYQYMFGSDILVAPVIQPNVQKQNVYLPNDKWIYLWNKTDVNPGAVTVNAPVGLPPVFVRKNSSFLNDILSLASYELIPFNPSKSKPSQVSNNSPLTDFLSSVILVAFCTCVALRSIHV
ncbi:sulfoquinovosidase-like [Saccostrea echinata]|uniref:sulfoquinovosidase-like n=1 Tax=Saccostrea echinata TaxID=191078 RepID=UPI002A813CCC|nr:sulfoquinovosidase-like [Saccostrea echinata]